MKATTATTTKKKKVPNLLFEKNGHLVWVPKLEKRMTEKNMTITLAIIGMMVTQVPVSLEDVYTIDPVHATIINLLQVIAIAKELFAVEIMTTSAEQVDTGETERVGVQRIIRRTGRRGELMTVAVPGIEVHIIVGGPEITVDRMKEVNTKNGIVHREGAVTAHHIMKSRDGGEAAMALLVVTNIRNDNIVGVVTVSVPRDEVDAAGGKVANTLKNTVMLLLITSKRQTATHPNENGTTKMRQMQR